MIGIYPSYNVSRRQLHTISTHYYGPQFMTYRSAIQQQSNPIPVMNTIVGPDQASSSFICSTEVEEKLFVSACKLIPITSANAQSPAMIRIPCRARGVCDTHTPQSAYFELPKDCVHGKTLVCSHPKCRDSGRIFRYCKVCDQVTAKRNFTKRHAHDSDRNSTPRQSISLRRTDSHNSRKKKRKVSEDVEGQSLANLVLTAASSDDSTSDEETITSASGDVPIPFLDIAVEDTVCMMVSPSEAKLLNAVRQRARTEEAKLKLVQDLLQASHSLSQMRMMEEEILTDDESERDEAASRMPSLDVLNIFTSFEHLGM